MASDNKDSTPVPVGGIAVLLVLAAGIFLKHEYPFESSRPAESNLKAGQAPFLQDIDARLWEDPFAAITRWQEDKNDAKSLAPKAGSPRHDIGTLLTEIRNRKACVLGATVWGGPYPEDVEARRRIRYAVLAGLDHAGYVPDLNDKIGFIQVTLKSDYPGGAVVPFEFFENGTGGSLALLWLPEEKLGRSPNATLVDLFTRIGAWKEGKPVPVIGPAVSFTLKNLIKERGHCPGKKNEREAKGLEKGIDYYSWGSTADPRDLLTEDLRRCFPVREDAGPREAEKLLQGLFRDGTRVVRTINNDAELTQALATELKLRRVSPLGSGSSDHVVLVSEWDTDYGRKLPEQFIKAVCAQSAECDHAWVTNVSYLRGLDGGVASPTGKPEDKETQGKEGKNAGDSKLGGPSERTDGNSQYDYLRRLASAVEQRMHGLSGKHVSAVGVLGSDPFDKLLVLQALRPQFPDALFFTTDLDARLLQPSQHEWTRNLLVASGHDLLLAPEMQGRAPPFRDNYQTSAFLAVMLALDSNADFDKNRTDLGCWLHGPRVFEIGRTGAFALQPSAEQNPAECKPPPSPADIRPALPFFQDSDSRIFLGIWPWIIAPAALAVLLCIYVWPLRHVVDRAWKGLREREWPWVLGVAFALLACALLAWLVSHNVLSNRQGEPFAWAEGISIWPTELIRLAAFALSLWFIGLTLKAIELEPGKPNGDFFPVAPRKDTPSARLYHWNRLYRSHRDSIDTHELWREFRRLEEPGARIKRLCVPFALYLFMLASLWVGLSTRPAVPCRGEFACGVDTTVVRTGALAFLVLLFFVVDSIRLGSTLIGNLSTGRSVYPPETLTRVRTALNIPQEVDKPLSELLDIRLIGAFTEQLGRRIYLPFVVLALMVVARSPIFDNWHIPPALFLTFLFAFFVTVICAVVLQRSAQRARGIAVGRMNEYLMQARGESCAKGSYVEQLQMMLDEIKETRRGAFLPFLQQPLVRAFLVPAGGLGGVQLLEYSLTGLSF